MKKSGARGLDQLSDRVMQLAKGYQLRSRDRICRHGITVSQCYALEAVAHTPGLLITELARAMSLNKSTASRVAESLRRASLVHVDAVPGNARARRVTATPSGAALAKRIRAEIRDEHRRAFSAFPDRDLQTCARMLDALLATPPLR